MTVCVSVKVNDCIVFAADSALTISNGGTIVNVYDSGDKVFNLHRQCPIAAMFCGMGSIEGRSVSNLSKELRWELMQGSLRIDPASYDLATVVERCHAFLDAKYSPVAGDPSHNMEYFVGGYGSAATHGEVWKVMISAGALQPPLKVRDEGEHGINWGGQISPIARLINGYDPFVQDILVQAGVTPENAQTLVNVIRGPLGTPLYSPAMPTRNVIRLAEFLVDVTKGYYSFHEGSDIVGGPTDIATVSKWEGFRWIRRKHYYPAALNGGDHGHKC